MEEEKKIRPYRFNYEVDSDGYLLSWRTDPFDESQPYIECEVYPELIVGVTKVVGDHFVMDFERRAELMKKLSRIDTLKQLLQAEYDWFDHYDIKIAEYNREVRMGIEPSVDVPELDREAEDHRKTVLELRKELEELEG